MPVFWDLSTPYLFNVDLIFFHQTEEFHHFFFFFFGKFLELLAINHSLSERRDIVTQLLKLYHFLVVLQLAWVPTSLQFIFITRLGLVLSPGCQSSCGIFLLVQLFPSIDTNFSYVITIRGWSRPDLTAVTAFGCEETGAQKKVLFKKDLFKRFKRVSF